MYVGCSVSAVVAYGLTAGNKDCIWAIVVPVVLEKPVLFSCCLLPSEAVKVVTALLLLSDVGVY